MKFLAQALRLSFWTLPPQRICTVAGLTLTTVVAVMAPATGTAELVFLGVFLTFLPALVMGGPLWRAVSAQRGLALAPYGRAKLLGMAVFIAALSGFSIASFYLFFWRSWLVPDAALEWRQWWRSFADTFMLASWWAIASFFAARSLLATFTVLLALLGGIYVVNLLDLTIPPEFRHGTAMLHMLFWWGVFATWYLRARRIAPPAWSSRQTDDQALVTRADTGGIAAGLSRHVALERLLLGGRSIQRIVVHWLIALTLLQAIVLGVRIVSGVDPDQVVPVQYSALLLVLPAMAAISWLAASHLRPLWLACGCDRAALFAMAERKLVVLAAGMAAVCAVAFLALWFGLSSRPPGSVVFGLCSLLGALLLPAYGALLHGKGGLLAAAILIVIALQPTFFAVFVTGKPGENWWWLALLPVATVALRTLARRRWLGQDMPRAATSTAF